MNNVLIHPTVSSSISAVLQLQRTTGQLVVIDGNGRVAKLVSNRQQRLSAAETPSDLPAA